MAEQQSIGVLGDAGEERKPLGLGVEEKTPGNARERDDLDTERCGALLQILEHHLDGSVSGTAPEVDAEELVPVDRACLE